MTITKNVDHNTLRITLEGRLDTNTAPSWKQNSRVPQVVSPN